MPAFIAAGAPFAVPVPILVTGTVAGAEITQAQNESASADCDQEHIACFRGCWRRKPPWPCKKGDYCHYAYCTKKCLAEYMLCIGKQVAEKAFDTLADAANWLSQHPEIVVGAIVVVAGVSYIVATGGTGALVLVLL